VWLDSVTVTGRTVDRKVPKIDPEPEHCQLGNKLGQVVHTHTHVPLSPSSIMWYRSKGGDALWLGR